MPCIVNLSAIHTLLPDSASINKFARLCDLYSTSCFNYCPSMFQSYSNIAWVYYQNMRHFETLIKPYKRGKMDTREFMMKLAAIFDFIETEKLEKNDSTQEYLMSDPKYQALEDAWDATIQMDDEMAKRFPELIDIAKTEPVYLISNTNELHVFAILSLLKKYNPEVNFYPNIDFSVEYNNRPIEIAPNIFLCLSYRYQLFKTLGQNSQQDASTTMSLLRQLVEHTLKNKTADITIISQYDEDRKEARRLGIPDDNIFSADFYFVPDTELTLS